MNPEAHEEAIRQWLLGILTQQDASFVVAYAYASAPAPRRPYATFMSLSERGPENPVRVTTDTPWPDNPARATEEVTEEKIITVTISVYSEDARAHARAILDAIHQQDHDMVLSSQGVVVLGPVSGIVERYVQRDVEYERFCVLDLELRYKHRHASPVDIILSVRGTGTITE